jgi:hypothetical protein
MKAIVVTDQAAGTAGMKLVERPEPQAAINDVEQVAIKNSIAGVLHGRLLRRRQCFATLLYPIQERLRYGT